MSVVYVCLPSSLAALKQTFLIKFSLNTTAILGYVVYVPYIWGFPYTKCLMLIPFHFLVLWSVLALDAYDASEYGKRSSVMGALDFGLCSMAIGATGTGKTETLKDLTRAVGKKCIVFNCSPALDHIVIGKMFKVRTPNAVFGG